MARRKRLLLFVLLLLVLLQLPFVFSLYRTYRLHKYLASLAVVSVPKRPFEDIRGGIHVHSAAGGHSLGTYAEIAQAAKDVGYRYVFITEHPKSRQLFQKWSDPGLAMIYGWDERQGEAGEMLCTEDRSICFQSGDDRPVASHAKGLEVFNLDQSASTNDSWFVRISFFYHRLLYPELFFFKLWTVDRSYLATWDRELRNRHLTGIGGSDAHQNIGLVLQTTSGDKLFTLMLDPYQESFRAVTNHVVLLPTEVVSSENVLAGLVRGSAYIAFEKVADPTGFSFHALEDGKARPMGSTVKPGATLVAQAPHEAVFRFFQNGKPWKTVSGSQCRLTTDQTGFYRLEVYLPDPPPELEHNPWIISNPIYVK
ncbi:MAG: hypothetical protein ACE15E_05710 [Acidobacteriota bacterium]